MKPCIHCGGEGKIIRTEWHAITANRMPAFAKSCRVQCTSCERETDSCRTEADATEEWEAGRAGFPDRGFSLDD